MVLKKTRQNKIPAYTITIFITFRGSSYSSSYFKVKMSAYLNMLDF